jgi:hypothetical protein
MTNDIRIKLLTEEWRIKNNYNYVVLEIDKLAQKYVNFPENYEVAMNIINNSKFSYEEFFDLFGILCTGYIRENLDTDFVIKILSSIIKKYKIDTTAYLKMLPYLNIKEYCSSKCTHLSCYSNYNEVKSFSTDKYYTYLNIISLIFDNAHGSLIDFTTTYKLKYFDMNQRFSRDFDYTGKSIKDLKKIVLVDFIREQIISLIVLDKTLNQSKIRFDNFIDYIKILENFINTQKISLDIFEGYYWFSYWFSYDVITMGSFEKYVGYFYILAQRKLIIQNVNDDIYKLYCKMWYLYITDSRYENKKSKKVRHLIHHIIKTLHIMYIFGERYIYNDANYINDEIIIKLVLLIPLQDLREFINNDACTCCSLEYVEGYIFMKHLIKNYIDNYSNPNNKNNNISEEKYDLLYKYAYNTKNAPEIKPILEQTPETKTINKKNKNIFHKLLKKN